MRGFAIAGFGNRASLSARRKLPTPPRRHQTAFESRASSARFKYTLTEEADSYAQGREELVREIDDNFTSDFVIAELQNTTRTDDDQQEKFEVQVDWELNKLMFNNEELRAASEIVGLSESRRVPRAGCISRQTMRLEKCLDTDLSGVFVNTVLRTQFTHFFASLLVFYFIRTSA